MIKRHIGAMIGAFLLSLAHLPLSADDAPPRTLPELAEGKARVFFLRQSSVFQSGKPVELKINGALVAKLRNRDYTFVDLLPGEHYFTVSAFPTTGTFRSGLTLAEKQVRFLLVRPNTRVEERRTLFRDTRRFDLDGGLFDVQEVGVTNGEDYRRSMRYRKPIATVPPLKRG